MRVLVTGATGFLGRYIVEHAAKNGHHVIAASRDGTEVPGAGSVQAYGDLAEGIALVDLSNVEAVIHCAARVHILKHDDSRAAEQSFLTMNAELPVKLVQAAREAGAKRFVQISSVAALASATRPRETLDDLAHPRPSTPYGMAKLAADNALASYADTDFIVTALRPPAIYGPGVSAWFVRLLRAAKAGLPLPLGAINNRRSFAFVGNIADAAVQTLELDRSGAFIVTDSLPISSPALYRKLLEAHGFGDRVWSLPPSVAGGLARIALGNRAQSLVGNAAFDGSRFAKELDWQPQVDMTEALARTVRME